jgi:2-C-methyl-D-erythritol 4-phosphate cytidylyltransferase
MITSMTKKIAVIVAAGNGTRMGSAIPKQYLPLLGRPVLWHSIAAFQNAFDDIEILLIVSPSHLAMAEEIRSSARIPGNIKLVAGGETRFESVRNGLDAITQKNAIIFVHDGVRCLVTAALIRRCYRKALETGNAVPAIRPVDSVRVETADGNERILRDAVRLIQTPQVFTCEMIKAAFQRDFRELFTDEATVVEESGIKINLIEGDVYNIKITTPVDLVIAERILSSKELL